MLLGYATDKGKATCLLCRWRDQEAGLVEADKAVKEHLNRWHRRVLLVENDTKGRKEYHGVRYPQEEQR